MQLPVHLQPVHRMVDHILHFASSDGRSSSMLHLCCCCFCVSRVHDFCFCTSFFVHVDPDGTSIRSDLFGTSCIFVHLVHLLYSRYIGRRTCDVGTCRRHRKYTIGRIEHICCCRRISTSCQSNIFLYNVPVGREREKHLRKWLWFFCTI